MSESNKQWIKIGLGVIAIGLIFYFGNQSVNRNLGIAYNEGVYGVGSMTYSQVTCNTTSTALIATSTRSSFKVANTGANTIYICKSSSACSATSGIPIYGTSSYGGSIFVQDDHYFGPYKCASAVTGTAVVYELAK